MNSSEALETLFDWDVPDYIIKAGKTFITINCADWDGAHKIRVTTQDVVYYYAKDARNISSGYRSLGSFGGDWRQIDELAKLCLAYFKLTNIKSLQRHGKKYGMELKGGG